MVFFALQAACKEWPLLTNIIVINIFQFDILDVGWGRAAVWRVGTDRHTRRARVSRVQRVG